MADKTDAATIGATLSIHPPGAHKVFTLFRSFGAWASRVSSTGRKSILNRDRSYDSDGGAEPTKMQFRFAAMSMPEITIHTAVLVIAVLETLISLADIAFWWVSRKMNRLT